MNRLEGRLINDSKEYFNRVIDSLMNKSENRYIYLPMIEDIIGNNKKWSIEDLEKELPLDLLKSMGKRYRIIFIFTQLYLLT
jgi:hypothetical protein